MNRLAVLTAAFAPVLLAAAPASAQIKEKSPEIDQTRKIPLPAGRDLALPEIAKPGVQRAAGCIKHELYNIQSINRYAVSFTIATSTGDQTFNLEADEIRYIPPSSGMPIASTAETLKWTRFLDTFERAAATRRPVLVDYELPSREVFGVYIQWEDQCAD